MQHWEVKQYGALINRILHSGEKRSSRAGDVYSVFGEFLTIDVSQEFPLLRGRKIFYKPVLGELAAMFRGPKNISDFKQFGCNYWDAWGKYPNGFPENHKFASIEEATKAKKSVGELTLDYGNAWINFNGVNQLEDVVQKLTTNRTDRRILISGWRPDRLGSLSLPCCHLLYQWYVRDVDTEQPKLDMIWYQRSVDTMVGLPSDIILAAAWNIILANQSGLQPGVIKFMLADTHIYENHIPQTLEYMRQLNKVEYKKLEYAVDPAASVFNFTPDMLSLSEYVYQPAIKFELNV